MKNMFLSLMLLAGITGCNAQNKNDIPVNDTPRASIIRPDVNSKVNKKFDEKGNLVSYDSTAMWSYRISDREHRVEADSVIAAFKKQFESGFPYVFPEKFGVPIWNDSLLYSDLTSPDYFMQKWRGNNFDMSRMMLQMDSFRTSFLNNIYPGLSSVHNN